MPGKALPFLSGLALTCPQHQAAGAQAEVEGHQVGHLWLRVQALAVDCKECQAEEKQEPCKGMGPETDRRLDSDSVTPGKRRGTDFLSHPP
jgi:hypothetical protein